ncbi:hypothetical protein HK405_015307, partial [Cladochytrium tenue]
SKERGDTGVEDCWVGCGVYAFTHAALDKFADKAEFQIKSASPQGPFVIGELDRELSVVQQIAQ